MAAGHVTSADTTHQLRLFDVFDSGADSTFRSSSAIEKPSNTVDGGQLVACVLVRHGQQRARREGGRNGGVQRILAMKGLVSHDRCGKRDSSPGREDAD